MPRLNRFSFTRLRGLVVLLAATAGFILAPFLALTSAASAGTWNPRSRSESLPGNALILEGYHDGANCDKIFGWAWDQSQPNAAVSVDIYDGSTRIATGVPADQFRSDLSGKGNGFHAFNFPTPASLKNGQTHSITVKFFNTSTNLNTTPKPLTCSLPDLTNSANPAAGYTAGQTGVQFQVTVNRSGGAIPAASVYVLDRVYFSTNSTWDSGDTMLWESNGSTPDFPVGVLNSNGTKSVVATMNPIPNVAAGTYYIIAYVDPLNPPSYPNGYEPESNENNNIAVYPVTIQAGQSGPTIASNPPSGPQLTTNFVTTGTGFTANGQIRQFLTFPNQSTPQEISQLKADSLGKFSSTYTTKCSDNPGTYTLYMIDVGTNSQSNPVRQTVTASPGCNAPTLNITPPSAAQGTTIQIAGTNYTHNGQVRRFTVFPNGVTYELPGTVANSAGQISIAVPTDCGTVVGSYTTYMLDVGSGTQSTRASALITAGSSCSSTAALSVAPGSGPRGTGFTFTGSGFTHNSIVNLSVTRGDGQPGNGGQYNTDSSGNVSFVITSQPVDPLGQWTFSLTDSSGNHASTTAQYTNAQPSGTDLMYYTASTIDVTIPDNTQFTPGQSQNKVWRIQNSGTNSWSNYHLVYVPGIVNGNTSSNLSSLSSLIINASPGQWINTPNLPIIAPSTAGTYYSYWQMQNGSGQVFGSRIYVKIRVVPKQGNALGFGTQSGRSGSNDSPPAKSGRNADPVDTATGNYNYLATDLRIPGRGLDLELARSYNSQDATPGPLGNGWSHTFNIYLTNLTSSSASLHYSDGKVLDYINQTGTDNFISSYRGYYDTLVRNTNGTWTLKKTDQRNYQFDASGRLTAIQDRNNNQISLMYSGSNLSQVTDTVGRTINFAYSGSLLTAITDPAGRNLQFTYDAGSNLISFRDARGNTNGYTYDANHRLLSIIDGRGNNLVVNTYDAGNRVATQKNGRANQWTFVYNADGSTSVFDPLNKETRYVQDTNFNLQQLHDRNTNTQFASGAVNVLYDENNNRSQTSDAGGNYAAYVYDQNGNVTSRSDPILNSRRAVYDSKNNPTQLTDEQGKTTQMGYDGNGNLTTLTDALNNSSLTARNSFGQPISVTDSNGNLATSTYDAQGNLTSSKDALNNSTSYGYDGIGRRTSMTDARGKITRYAYDANDNLLTVTDPLNNVTTYTYDANNNRLSMRDARANTTNYTYDENNLLIKETDAKGNFIQHTYDKLDRRISTRDKRGNITTYTYDNEGRLLTVVDPLGNSISYIYDANGNRTKVTDAKGQSTTFTFDALNRVTRIQDALNNAIQKEYDATGRLKKEIDPRGNATQFTYDAVGNLTQVTDAAAGTAKFTYDKNQNRITQTDPKNQTSNLTYDKLNRLLSTANPLGHLSSSSYDEVGNRIAQTDAKGQLTRYTYDSANRLSTITYQDNSTVQLTRDANGNVTRMVDSMGTSNYVYDELNRVTSATDPFGKTIGYQYDENGNITKLTYPDGKQVSYQHDANNRMSSLSDWAGKTTSFQYDATNLLTKVTYPNGVISQTTYDNAGRLITKSDSGISSYSFTLDKNGNRTAASVTQPLANRLQNTSHSYAYDAANRIQNAGPATFSFDANGNMTSKTEAGVTTNYGYDFENRLVSVSGSSQYFYNGLGVRLQKIEGTKTTRYIVDTNHDLSQVLCETDANGAIASYYVYGMGLAYKVNPDGTHYYYHFDPVGSTIAVTDDGKVAVNSYAYDEFGRAENKIENTTNSFRFGGQYGLLDEGNGLLYVRARYYSPALGRFLSRDVVAGQDANPQSWNRYAYAFQNPLRFMDPSGEIVFSLGIGGDAGIILGVTGQVALVSDDQGQHGFALSGGTSASLQAGTAISGSISITNDRSITDLDGKGYSIGAGGGDFGFGYDANILLDSSYQVKGVSFSVGAGKIGIGIGTTTTWGKVYRLSNWQYNAALSILGPAGAPLAAFDTAVKIGNSSRYSELINNAARQQSTSTPRNGQSGPFQPRGPQVGPANPVGRATKN
ncbi:MAG TPA: DUF6531 domain-containing protein [Pyrinomonadaceae bacterium]|nr:DUF6531 domain-containing protein [Pyrinomonadaceae bacterium]